MRMYTILHHEYGLQLSVQHQYTYNMRIILTSSSWFDAFSDQKFPHYIYVYIYYKTNFTPNVLKSHCFRVLIILSRGLWIIIAVFPDLFPKHTREVSIVICFPLLGIFLTYIEIKNKIKKGSLWHLWYLSPEHCTPSEG